MQQEKIIWQQSICSGWGDHQADGVIDLYSSDNIHVEPTEFVPKEGVVTRESTLNVEYPFICRHGSYRIMNKDNKKYSDPKLVMRIPTLDKLKKMLMEMNNDKVVELSYCIFYRQSIQISSS